MLTGSLNGLATVCRQWTTGEIFEYVPDEAFRKKLAEWLTKFKYFADEQILAAVALMPRVFGDNVS